MELAEKKMKITDSEDFATIKPEEINLIKLDIGCGKNKKFGFTGVDISKNSDADIIHDLGVYPWPIETDSVFEANISHYVEHVKDLKTFMEELYRIMMPEGTVYIQGPYWSSERAWQDYTHVRALTPHTFSYFDQKWLITNGLDHYDVKADFECLNLRYYFLPEWESRAEEAKMYATTHYINVCGDIGYFLKACKPKREIV